MARRSSASKSLRTCRWLFSTFRLISHSYTELTAVCTVPVLSSWTPVQLWITSFKSKTHKSDITRKHEYVIREKVFMTMKTDAKILHSPSCFWNETLSFHHIYQEIRTTWRIKLLTINSVNASVNYPIAFTLKMISAQRPSPWNRHLALIWYRCFSLAEEIWLHFTLTTSWCVRGEGLGSGVWFQEELGRNSPGRPHIRNLNNMVRKRGIGVQRHTGLKQAQTCAAIQISSSPWPGPLTAQVQGGITASPEAGNMAFFNNVCPQLRLLEWMHDKKTAVM